MVTPAADSLDRAGNSSGRGSGLRDLLLVATGKEEDAVLEVELGLRIGRHSVGEGDLELARLAKGRFEHPGLACTQRDHWWSETKEREDLCGRTKRRTTCRGFHLEAQEEGDVRLLLEESLADDRMLILHSVNDSGPTESRHQIHSIQHTRHGDEHLKNEALMFPTQRYTATVERWSVHPSRCLFL